MQITEFSDDELDCIPRRPTHADVLKLIQANNIKHTHVHNNTSDDQLMKDNLNGRTIDLTVFRIQYVSSHAWRATRMDTTSSQSVLATTGGREGRTQKIIR